MLQSLALPFFLFACFSLNINKSCVSDLFYETLIYTMYGHPDNTDTMACPPGVLINRAPHIFVLFF